MFDSVYFKKGDSVVVYDYRTGIRTIQKITNITPTGRIMLDNTKGYFDKQGKGMGWILNLSLEALPFPTTTENSLKGDLFSKMADVNMSLKTLLIINSLVMKNGKE